MPDCVPKVRREIDGAECKGKSELQGAERRMVARFQSVKGNPAVVTRTRQESRVGKGRAKRNKGFNPPPPPE